MAKKKSDEIELFEKLAINNLLIQDLAKQEDISEILANLELSESQETLLNQILETEKTKSKIVKVKNTYTLLKNVIIKGVGAFNQGKITEEQYLKLLSINVQISQFVKIEKE